MRNVRMGLLAPMILVVSLFSLLVSTQAFAKDGDKKAQVSLTGAAAFPIGDIRNDVLAGGLNADTGMSVGVVGNYFIFGGDDNQLSVMGSVVYFPLNLDDETIGTTKIELDGDMWGLTGGFRYGFLTGEVWSPYVDAAVGAYFIDIDMTATTGTVSVGSSASDTGFGYNIGLGNDWYISDKIAAGIFARYHGSFHGSTDFENIETGVALSYTFR